MNEEVVQDTLQTDPLDTGALTVLRLRLQVITDFCSRVAQYTDEYEAILFAEYEAAQRRLDEEREAA